MPPTRITKRSGMGSLLYFYRFGWCLPRALDVIKIVGVKVHFGFPGNWFATSPLIPTRIAKRSVMGSLLYFYRFGCWLPCVIKSDGVKVNFRFLGNWFATWRVTPTRIAKRSVMSCWYISIDLFDVYLDVIKGGDIMVHLGFPGKWFATLRVTPTRIAK